MNIPLTIFICLFLLTSCNNSSTPSTSSTPVITPNPSPTKLKPYPCRTDLNYNCNSPA